MKDKLVITLLFLIVLTSFTAAELSSSNYKVASYAVSSGGSNISSSNYKTNFNLGGIMGNISSDLYKLLLGFWYTVGADTQAPTVSIIYPINNSLIVSNSIDLNASATDNLASSLTYYWVINGTTNTTTTDKNTTFNASDGYYNLTLFVSDGLQNGSSTIFFTLDTTAPLLSFAGGTPSDASRPVQTYLYANVSVTGSNFKNITFELRNSTTVINTTTYTTPVYSINWTNLSGGDYTYNVTAYCITEME